MCQTFLISFLSRIKGVGSRNSRYVFSTAFGSAVERRVAFLRVNKLKDKLKKKLKAEIIMRQVKDSLKYCVQGTVIARLADGEAA